MQEIKSYSECGEESKEDSPLNGGFTTITNNTIMLSPITLKFLEAVKINNNTERMHRNRDLYLQERKRFTELVEHLIIDMQKLDPNLEGINAKDCVYRFNKDLRFSPDKSHPYKLHFGAFLCS